MKHLLRDNALEAWSMAVKYCYDILDGKATLSYRKNFVSSLHNAVELFIKQRMLDINDFRVVEIKNGVMADGQPAKDYFNSSNLNDYFLGLNQEQMKPFFSVEFNKLSTYSKELFAEYYNQTGNKGIVCDAMKKLTILRNNEMHFYIDKNMFLSEEDFCELHNFMITFYEILQKYSLLPFWGEPGRGEYSKLSFRKEKIEHFTYKKAVKNSIFVKKLKENVADQIFPEIGSSAYEIAESIAFVLSDKYDAKKFGDLWTYIELMLEYDLLTYEIVEEEYECEEEDNVYYGCNRYRTFSVNI